MPNIKEKVYEIQYFHTDFRGRSYPARLLNFCDDIAVSQTEELGVGIRYLQENGLAWVLCQWDVEFHRYPVFREFIRLKTIPSASRKFYAYRRYEMYDDKDNLLMAANTSWFLLDIEKKRPVKVPESLRIAYGMESGEDAALAIEKPRELSNADAGQEFLVRFGDIDSNRHVNNVRYAEWAIDSLPEDFLSSHMLRGLRIFYKKEALYGKRIRALSETKEKGRFILHKIVDEEGNDLCLIESLWEAEKSEKI